MTFIPYLSTEAGRCLTAQNWHEVGVQVAAYELTELLFKPGYTVLQRLSSLKRYIGWPYLILLDIRLPYDKQSMSALLRSPYDGSRVDCRLDMVRECIIRLQPDGIIFSPEFDASLFLEQRDESVFQTFKTSTAQANIIPCNASCRDALCEDASEKIYPFSGYPSIQLSNEPANDAYQGVIYHDKATTSSILSPQYQFDFEPLSSFCQCPPCQQGLTRAYFHHLYQQTPLLCQRWLIQHNIWMKQIAL